MPCNVCDDEFHRALLRGDRAPLEQSAGELHCSECGSRPRTRTFRLVYDEHIVPLLRRASVPDKALDIAGIGATRDILRQDFSKVVLAALVGRPITTDIRRLEEFEDDSLGLVTACNVLDYIMEIPDAFAAVHRVLAPAGIWIFHIIESRLLNGAQEPDIKGYLHGRTLGRYYPEDYHVPSIVVGKQWLLMRMTELGFHAEQYNYVDAFSGELTTWYLGRKVPMPVSLAVPTLNTDV